MWKLHHSRGDKLGSPLQAFPSFHRQTVEKAPPNIEGLQINPLQLKHHPYGGAKTGLPGAAIHLPLHQLRRRRNPHGSGRAPYSSSNDAVLDVAGVGIEQNVLHSGVDSLANHFQ